ncbi:MAG: hypothetical protein KDB93_08040 [Flavobacteriales bacterium]|nr:hypothetical protein [Flavobacteriales bacterium]
MRYTSTLLFLTISVLAHAQGTVQRYTNDSGSFVLHRFTTGQISSREWMDLDNRWGRSWAYDRQGHVIYEQQTRRIAGHATVDFRYHPNGAVSRADYSTMPDGGIQWYESTTTFDENGKQTGFTEQGQDDHGPVPGPTVPGAPKHYPKEIVQEQRLFTNEYFVVNGYRKPVRLKLQPKQTSPAAKDIDATLLHGDTLRGGTYSMGEQWVEPLSQVVVNVRPAKGRKKLAISRTDTVQVSPEHRRYFLVIGRVR